MHIDLRRMAVAIAAAVALVVTLTGPRGAAAQGSTSAICVSPSQCLNDWFNGGPGTIVRLYPTNNTNEQFTEQVVPGRCGGYRYVTHDCPFSNRHFDRVYHGSPVVQLEYGSTNQCVATSSARQGTGLAVMGICNNVTTGYGGSNGSLFVEHNGALISVYWSDRKAYGGDAACMEPVNGTGLHSFVFLNLPTDDGCAAWSAARATAPTPRSSFCGQRNNCLNDWNNGGAGNTVRLYPRDRSNEEFSQQALEGRCGGGHVTATCPFGNAYLDHVYHGSPILQLRYGATNACVATDPSQGTAEAVMGTCNNPATGYGGSIGTLFVDHDGYMINVYWTNRSRYGDNAACMEPMHGTGSRSYVYLDLPTADGCAVWSQR